MSTFSDIQSLIPQRPPFVMIDSIVGCDRESCRSVFTVKDDNIFLRENELEPYALIENIAQTAAAGMSATRTLADQLAPEGFLGAITNADVIRLPSSGEKVETETRILAEIGSLFKILGKCSVNGQICFTCTMSLASRPISKN